ERRSPRGPFRRRPRPSRTATPRAAAARRPGAGLPPVRGSTSGSGAPGCAGGAAVSGGVRWLRRSASVSGCSVVVVVVGAVVTVVVVSVGGGGGGGEPTGKQTMLLTSRPYSSCPLGAETKPWSQIVEPAGTLAGTT